MILFQRSLQQPLCIVFYFLADSESKREGHATFDGREKVRSNTQDEPESRTDPIHFPRKRAIVNNNIEVFVKVRSEFTSNYNANALMLSLEPEIAASSNALTPEPWNRLLRATKPPEGELAKQFGS